MVKEIMDQIENDPFTHVFLQAGVGGMAAAMIAGFAKFSNNIPKFIIVEPENANCVFKSIENNKPTTVNIVKETIMGGMSCGDVSTVAWEILKNSANYCLTISDEAISSTVAMLAEAKLSNEKIIAGECAVPGVIALISLFKNKEYMNKLDLNSNSKILLFGCEGLTDKTMYQKLLDDGLKKI
jgi:diaminopropionate ammonia-lyase